MTLDADLDAAICPVTPAPASIADVSPADVVDGQRLLAALTGRYLPAAPGSGGGRGATVVTAGGGEPVFSRDYKGRGANWLFGWMGEQSAGFAYGLQGFDLVEGSSGTGGKASTARGLDLLMWHAPTQTLLLNDNKQGGTPGPVDSCTALNENLASNVAAAESQARASTHPDSAVIADKLVAAQKALADPANNAWPDGVRLKISNAGGLRDGIAQSLHDDFNDRYEDVTHADGSPLRLEFDDVQVPATRQAAVAASSQATEQAFPQELGAPLTFYSAPTEPAGVPAGLLTGSRSSAALGEGAMAAAPLLFDWGVAGLEWLLDKLGVPNSERRSVNSVMTDQVGPYLQRNPSQVAVIAVHRRWADLTPDRPAQPQVISATPAFGSSAREAYDTLQQLRYFERPASAGEMHDDVYWWAHDGKLEMFFPSSLQGTK